MSDKALDLFERMSLDPNNVIYTIIFDACTQLKNTRGISVGKKLVNEIFKKSNINNIVLNSAIHMLLSFGDVKHAEQLFESIERNDVVSYRVMMKAYNLNNNPLKCLKLFEKMKKQDIIPDEITFILLIRACSQLSMLSICQSIVAQIPSYLYNNQRICSALIDMWASIHCYKCLSILFNFCIYFIGQSWFS
jgi:pentatricopeptide repeat protein